jgi:peroxiredoxin
MRKVGAVIFFVLLIGGAIYFFMGDPGNTRVNEQAQATEQNDLPDLELITLEGDHVQARDISGKAVFVLFQPDCDHCQREAVDFREHLQEFKDYSLYFISSADADEIRKFAQEYELEDKPNVVFAMAQVSQVIRNYGPISAPSVYIYAEGKLMKSFNGETAIEVILKYI